jgi:hypothetical protein
MITTEGAFLILLFSGILALVCGLGLTRVHWRTDIPPYGRRTRFIDVMLHPERYGKDAPLRAIRSLNLLGALLLGAAAGVLAYEIFHTILRQ